MDDPRGWRNGQHVILRRSPKAALEGFAYAGLRPSRLASLAPQDDEAQIRLARIWE
jgi:hypothetical protein